MPLRGWSALASLEWTSVVVSPRPLSDGSITVFKHNGSKLLNDLRQLSSKTCNHAGLNIIKCNLRHKSQVQIVRLFVAAITLALQPV